MIPDELSFCSHGLFYGQDDCIFSVRVRKAKGMKEGGGFAKSDSEVRSER
jgi:hypothetical protein